MTKIKVVIVESQSGTDMVIAGTQYFADEKQARNFVLEYNARNVGQAYVVHVSSAYRVTGID
jgi:hypothetical protein